MTQNEFLTEAKRKIYEWCKAHYAAMQIMTNDFVLEDVISDCVVSLGRSYKGFFHVINLPGDFCFKVEFEGGWGILRISAFENGNEKSYFYGGNEE